MEETVVMLKYVGVEGDGAAPPSFFLRREVVSILEWKGKGVKI